MFVCHSYTPDRIFFFRSLYGILDRLCRCDTKNKKEKKFLFISVCWMTTSSPTSRSDFLFLFLFFYYYTPSHRETTASCLLPLLLHRRLPTSSTSGHFSQPLALTIPLGRERKMRDYYVSTIPAQKKHTEKNLTNPMYIQIVSCTFASLGAAAESQPSLNINSLFYLLSWENSFERWCVCGYISGAPTKAREGTSIHARRSYLSTCL